MKRAVIICGANINNYEFVSSYFRPDDYFIYCDSGLKHEEAFCGKGDRPLCGKRDGGRPVCENSNTGRPLGSADLIVGDFDSYKRPVERELDTEIISLPREKDDTDSMYAIKEAVKRGFDEFLIVGAVGNRLDHSLVNVYALIYLYELGLPATIVDDYSELLLIGKNKPELVDIKYEYFSLITVSGVAKGVDITNAKYNLENAVINPSYQYATSNEPLKESGKPACISLKDGYLLLIRVVLA